MQQQDISAQKTAPLRFPTANEFNDYMRQHKLLWIQVARAADVPALTVWSIDHGLAVFPLQALRVRQGLYTLTKVWYAGPIKTIPATTLRKNRVK